MILQGSARPDGHTAQAVAALTAALGALEVETIDVAAADIGPFAYDRRDLPDDFDRIVERMLHHRALLIATPVYWYAMSGPLKTLFDRFTDLLTHDDPERRGRQLAGRELWLLAVGTDAELPEGFTVPFARTAAYFDMVWREAAYCPADKGGVTGDGLARAATLGERIGTMLSQ